MLPSCGAPSHPPLPCPPTRHPATHSSPAAPLQGVDGGDVDLPTVLESTFIIGLLSKLFFTFVYLGIYAVRPLVVRPKAASEWQWEEGPREERGT